MKNKFKFELGQEVKDKFSEMKGIIMARTQYLTGCTHYSVFNTTLDKEGYPREWFDYDEARLILIKKKPLKLSNATGGPAPTTRSTNR